VVDVSLVLTLSLKIVMRPKKAQLRVLPIAAAAAA
jgi:hypothetical protein